jgi:hypothetical protein
VAAKHVTVKVSAPVSEYELWLIEAQRRGIKDDLGKWLRVVANYAIAAEVDGERPASLGRRRRLAEVAMNCVNCGTALGMKRSARKRYCSDVCRVTAWRMRQRTARTRRVAAVVRDDPLAT